MGEHSASGHAESVLRAIELIDQAHELAEPCSNTIYISWPGSLCALDHAPHLRTAWRNALRQAMRKGWDVALMITPRDHFATTEVVDDILESLGSNGRFLPGFASDSPFSLPSREVVVVPSHGAVEMSSSDRDQPQVHSVGSHLDDLAHYFAVLVEYREPLIDVHPQTAVGFTEAIATAENQPGRRCVTLNGLSELTLPLDIHVMRARNMKFADQREEEQVSKMLLSRVKRYSAFDRQVVRSEVYDVCPMQAVEGYLQTGEYSPDDVFRHFGADVISPAIRAWHLNWFIDRLGTIHNYHFGLLDKPQADAIRYLEHTYWMAKEDDRVLIEFESSRLTGQASKFGVEIREQSLVQAFTDHFQTHIWERIPTDHKDPRWVRRWIRRRILA